MDDRISARQVGAWGFGAVTVPAVLTCAGLGWGWVLLGCAIAAVYFGLTESLGDGAIDLRELTYRAFGKGFGRVWLVLGAAFALVSAAQTASQAHLAFPDETGKLAGPVILVLAALANRKGAEQAARVCGVMSLILAALYTIVLLSAARQVKLSWLTPWGAARQTIEVLPPMLALTCLRFLPGRRGRVKGGWLALLVLGPAALAAVTAGCLSPRLTMGLSQPFYTVSQSLSVLDVMERFEPLVSAALLMGFFALESLLFAACRAQLDTAVTALWEKKWASAALGVLAFGLMFATRGIGPEAWALGAAIFWGMGPLLTQLIVAIK